MKHDQSVNIFILGKMTINFSPTEIQNLVNIVAIQVDIKGNEPVAIADLQRAFDKQTLGTEWKSRFRHKDDLKLTANYEAKQIHRIGAQITA